MGCLVLGLGIYLHRKDGFEILRALLEALPHEALGFGHSILRAIATAAAPDRCQPS